MQKVNPARRILAETIRKMFPPQIEGADNIAIDTGDIVWALGSFSALNQIPFDAALLLPELPASGSIDALLLAARKLGFKCRRVPLGIASLPALTFPSLVFLKYVNQEGEDPDERVRPAILVRVSGSVVTYFKAGTNVPTTESSESFGSLLVGVAIQIAPGKKALSDPDGRARRNTGFGFAWFIAELLKYKSVWRDVLIASLAIQLLALGTPLFTQVVIDKVVVHRTESTLLVIGIGLALFMLFTALLTWVRQYLVLHTGNRVDAVLGSSVFSRLFKLPPRYFEHRPTGVIAARLRGVENIREFISSAAVTLVLDLPFLLIFVAIMFVYNVKLTFVVLGLVVLVGIVTTTVAPIFRNRLNEQFLIGARNQAFVTEYISGLETVKSLQLEPQIEERYSTYLAEYMSCGFGVKQIGNTYNAFANGVEQLMTLLVLVLGAYTVMHDPQFTIGMLVAFQMFASRVSQPMLRMVGLWQQYQQASLSVARLGDIMDVAPEPYSIVPFRATEAKGRIDVKGLSFRYSDKLPLLYRDFNMTLLPGRTVAVMGPSGSGKSTLAKLLLAFYQPTEGSISVDGNDIRNCSANELRRNFGVVPQETVLFSGTVYDNLIMANPHATFDDVVGACRMAEIHDAIERLAEGYKTEIGERGAGLSGGQKQRIAIARALLKRPKVLIFDEATSSLDAQTAEHFATTVNSLRGKVTMLFITHHLPESLKVDQIVRIGPLQSVDAGDPAEALPTGELA